MDGLIKPVRDGLIAPPTNRSVVTSRPAPSVAAHDPSILLEDGSYLLLESGDTILLE